MSKKKIIEDREELCDLAPVMNAPLKHHVFVCKGSSCTKVGSEDVKEAFEKELRSRNMLQGKEKKGKNPMGSVVLTDCGSVGLCAIGTAVLVYPEGIWYGQVRDKDVTEIVEEHLINGRVVERLALFKVGDKA